LDQLEALKKWVLKVIRGGLANPSISLKSVTCYEFNKPSRKPHPNNSTIPQPPRRIGIHKLYQKIA